KYQLTGPVAPDALDEYHYELLDITALNGKRIYRMRMTPKSQSTALWEGVVSIADSTWDVVEVDVRPNDAVSYPNFDSIHYSQTFSLIDGKYWLPADMMVDISFAMNSKALAGMRMNNTSVLYDYSINQPISDVMFSTPTIRVDTSALRFDTTYWREHEVLPLTAEEQIAYYKLDTVFQKVDSVLAGPIALYNAVKFIGDLPITDFGDIYHFDRVEGHALGLGVNVPWHATLPATTLIGKFSYGFSDKRSKWETSLAQKIIGGGY